MNNKVLSGKSLDVLQILTLLFVISTAAIVFQRSVDNLTRFYIITCVAIFYVFWGCWHHWSKSRLTFLVFAEYALVGLIGILIAALGLGVIRFF